MGKVLSTFMNGFPGSVSRSADELVISMKNADTAPIPPGAPVFLSSDGKGVTLTRTNSVFAGFVGVAVRIPSRTPDTYGADTAPYAPGDPVDILVRGCVVVTLQYESCRAGGAVHLTLATGAFTTEAEQNATIQLTNCSWRRAADLSDNHAELVIRERNLV